MTTRANVTSVDAIESFRASLVLYTSKARPTLEEVSAEIVRARVWLKPNSGFIGRLRCAAGRRKLEDAQQALFSAGFPICAKSPPPSRWRSPAGKNALDEAKEIQHW